MNIVIGIDPDSKAHGVAVYADGELVDLRCMTLLEVMEYTEWGGLEVVHIENVCGTSASFMARDKKSNQNVKLKMAQHIGQCKQAQIELERLFEHLGIKVVKHKISKMWKKDKKQFELVTGWTGRSNEDTRSAAYFGWLGLK
jgi:hypothetical protein